MNKKNPILLLVILFTLGGVTLVEAFVPQTPHLLHLMVRKIRRPQALECIQTRTELSGEEETGVFSETLKYRFPDQFRSDLRLPDSQDILLHQIQSGRGFVKILTRNPEPRAKALADHAFDVLLLRDPIKLARAIKQAGVDIDTRAFHRFGDRVCYVIGDPAQAMEDPQVFPSIWIEKETLFPLRYLLRQEGRTVEFRYRDWQQISKSWYPMETHILVNEETVTRIRVDDIQLKAGFPEGTFDIPEFQNLYPLPVVDKTL